MLHVRNVSTKAEVEKLNEYTAHYHAAMHELSLLSSLDNEADLQAYFAAVVLPLRRAYAWGVPSTDALQAIAEASPLGVVEVGAGTGYWAHLLQDQYGVSVRAYDSHPRHDQAYINGFHTLGGMGNALPFFRVEEGGAEAAGEHPERTLLLCWPPRESDGSGTGDEEVAYLARDALSSYQGDCVAYVGVCRTALAAGESTAEDDDKSDGGAMARFDTAGPAFEALLSSQFELSLVVPIPNWPPLHDKCTIWRRKGAPATIRGTVSGDQRGEAGDWAVARRRRAREAALSSIRWSGFDRAWLLRTLRDAYRMQGSANSKDAAPRSGVAEMAQRCLAHAPWWARALGNAAAQHLLKDGRAAEKR